MNTIQISFKGIVTSPSPDKAEPGECSMLINTKPQKGTLSATEFYNPICIVPQFALLYVHKINSRENFITRNGGKIYFEFYKENELYTPNTAEHLIADISIFLTTQDALVSIESIGNILSIVCESTVLYIQYIDLKYSFLGEIPKLPSIEFSNTEVKSFTEPYGALDNSFYFFKREISKDEFNDTQSTQITNSIMGCYGRLRKAVAEAGCFYAPFLLRYAFKLYDGSYIHHSSPFLYTTLYNLMKSSAYKRPYFPDLILKEVLLGYDANSLAVLGFELLNHDLKAQLLGSKIKATVDFGNLAAWKDIIVSLDIFASPAINTIDVNQPIKKYERIYPVDSNYNPDLSKTPNLKLDCAYKSIEEIDREIGEMGSFYLIHSIPTVNIETGKKEYVIDSKEKYKQITLQTPLPTCEMTHHKFGGNISYNYNNRLHLANCSHRLFEGFSMEYFSSLRKRSIDPSLEAPYSKFTTYVYLKTQEGIRIVKNEVEGKFITNCIHGYISYPDPRAYLMEIYRSNTRGINGAIVNEEKIALTLKPHLSLNIAYYLEKAGDDIKNFIRIPAGISGSSNIPQIKVRDLEKQENKLKVSMLQNPFIFPSIQTYLISNDEITGLEVASIAFSQGQYGEFPLYVFTLNGIWAMRVGIDLNLAYSSQHLISKEVCTDNYTIAACDKGVFFICDEKLKILNGTEIIDISSAIDGEQEVMPNDLRSIISLIPDLNLQDCNLKKGLLNIKSIHYNYHNNEIWLNRSDSNGFALIYALGENSWHYVHHPYKEIKTLNGDIYGIGNDSQIYPFIDSLLCAKNVQRLMLSRPIKLNNKQPFKIRGLRWDYSGIKITYDSLLFGSNKIAGNYKLLNRIKVSEKKAEPQVIKINAPAFLYYKIAFIMESAKNGANINGLELEVLPCSPSKLS